MKIIHRHFTQLASTNDWGKAHIKSLDPGALIFVTADEQTKGRGRYSRSWHSPAGVNLYGSFCFFIDENQQDPLSLTHVLAISATGLLERYGIACRLKWPNDLFVSGKKIAGILCETVDISPKIGVVMGMGLNVNMSAEALKEIDQPATSILQETGSTTSLEEIRSALQEQFVPNLEQFLHEGFSPFLATFQTLIFPSGPL